MKRGSIIRRGGRSFVVDGENVAVTTVTVSNESEWELLSSMIDAGVGHPIKKVSDLVIGDVIRNLATGNIYIVAHDEEEVIAVYLTTIGDLKKWRVVK